MHHKLNDEDQERTPFKGVNQFLFLHQAEISGWSKRSQSCDCTDEKAQAAFVVFSSSMKTLSAEGLETLSKNSLIGMTLREKTIWETNFLSLHLLLLGPSMLLMNDYGNIYVIRQYNISFT